MKRKSATSITVDHNIRALKIYPIEGPKKQLSELKTVGFILDKQEAIKLARVLLLASQEWGTVDITCYRSKKRKRDQTYPLTITSQL